MSRPSISTLFDYKLEEPFFIDGKLRWVLTTEFSSMDYNKIFNQYPDKEFPIVLEDGMPIIVNEEPVRDYTDKQVLEYNNLMYLYRLASLMKLIIHNSSDIEKMSIDEVVSLLKAFPISVFEELESKINYIVEIKFNLLNNIRRKMARKVLAFTDDEKRENDRLLKDVADKRQQCFNEKDKLTLLLQEIKDKNEINTLQLQITELDKQINQYEKILNINQKDNIKVNNGITIEFVLLSLSEKYSWIDKDFLIRAMKNDLSHEEEVLLELIKSKNELDCEESSRQYDKFNKNTSKESS